MLIQTYKALAIFFFLRIYYVQKMLSKELDKIFFKNLHCKSGILNEYESTAIWLNQLKSNIIRQHRLSVCVCVHWNTVVSYRDLPRSVDSYVIPIENVWYKLNAMNAMVGFSLK